MNKQQVKGATNKVTGSVKEGVGRMTGDRSEVARGQARQVKGEVQQGAGNVKESMRESKSQPSGRRSSDR